MQRAICAIKGIGENFKAVYLQNDLATWLYGGTTSGVYGIYPGFLTTHNGGDFDKCSASK